MFPFIGFLQDARFGNTGCDFTSHTRGAASIEDTRRESHAYDVNVRKKRMRQVITERLLQLAF
jgi:hypothetical protein